MKNNLTLREYIFISSMLFGLFFGAGNLIFPVHLGQMAGSNVWLAALGFVITGVGIPILGVAAIGITRSNGLQELASQVGKRYGIFFTCLLYLTIGPFFAIPRCATVPYSMGLDKLLGINPAVGLGVFTLIFFAIVLFFSLKPQGIMTWIGKILNPLFLTFLAILVGSALFSPMADSIAAIAPAGPYADQSLIKGFLEGYNTMDAMAGLAFGIIIVQSVRDLGVKEPGRIAAVTVKAGILSGLLMAFIYVLIMVMGAMSRGTFAISDNGSIALAEISGHYFGTMGNLFLVVIAGLACLKTSIGLVTSCSATFRGMWPEGPAYNTWCVIFSLFSLLIANLGLTAIIAYSIPVLMLLYPLSITLIALALLGGLFNHQQIVYRIVTSITFAVAMFDFAGALPPWLRDTALVHEVIGFAGSAIPLYGIGMGWVIPAFIGLLLGLLVKAFKNNERKV